MKRTFIATTTRLLCLAAVSSLALAHGGFEHVMGTVTKVDGNVLTVKTAKGDVAVKVDAKTEYTKDDKKATVKDVTVGLRVVVDLPEKVKDPAAHSIKIGVAEAAEDHSAHK